MSKSLIPALVTVGSLLAAVRIALDDPDQRRRRRQPSTKDQVRGRAATSTGSAAVALSGPDLLATPAEPRRHGRIASGLGLVVLVMLLGMLLAAGIGAAVVAVTMALRETVS